MHVVGQVLAVWLTVWSAGASATLVQPLIQAAQSNNMSFLVQLVNGGSDVNVVNTLRRTAAHYAVLNMNKRALKLLLENGADPNLADVNDQTLYDLWAKHKDKAMLELLHRAEAKPLDLFQAVENNDRPSLERLLGIGEDVLAKNDAGKVPFQLAVELEHYALAAILLKTTDGIDGRDERSWRPIHWAMMADDWDLVQELIAAGADLNAGRAQNALDLAEDLESEKQLIEAFVAVKGVNGTVGECSDPLLIVAAKRGNMGIAELLIALNADVDAENVYGRTALTIAVQFKNNHMAKFFVANKADVNIQDRQGRTAITWATFNKDVEMVNFLIDNDADIDIPNNNGSTVLKWAAEFGNVEMTQIYIDNHADVNVQSNDGNTPLILAAKKGDTDNYLKVAELLIAHKADINAQNKYEGRSPLIAAVVNRQIKTVEWLLKHGAEPNLRNNRGGTALSIAAQLGFVDIAQLLLANGADPTLKNSRGKTPLDIAEEIGHDEVVKILRTAQGEH